MGSIMLANCGTCMLSKSMDHDIKGDNSLMIKWVSALIQNQLGTLIADLRNKVGEDHCILCHSNR